MSLAFIMWKIFSFIKFYNKKSRNKIVTKLAYRCRSSLLSICGYEVIVDIYLFFLLIKIVLHTTHTKLQTFCSTFFVSLSRLWVFNQRLSYIIPSRKTKTSNAVCLQCNQIYTQKRYGQPSNNTPKKDFRYLNENIALIGNWNKRTCVNVNV